MVYYIIKLITIVVLFIVLKIRDYIAVYYEDDEERSCDENECKCNMSCWHCLISDNNEQNHNSENVNLAQPSSASETNLLDDSVSLSSTLISQPTLDQQILPAHELINQQHCEESGIILKIKKLINMFVRLFKIIKLLLFINNNESCAYKIGDKTKSYVLKNRPREVICNSSKRILTEWLFENIESPYPSLEQKQDLSIRSNLSIEKISKWFVNERQKLLNKRQFVSNTSNKNVK
jgi:hypothetical protein